MIMINDMNHVLNPNLSLPRQKKCLKLTLKHENFARAYLRTIASANIFARITFSVHIFYLKKYPV